MPEADRTARRLQCHRNVSLDVIDSESGPVAQLDRASVFGTDPNPAPSYKITCTALRWAKYAYYGVARKTSADEWPTTLANPTRVGRVSATLSQFPGNRKAGDVASATSIAAHSKVIGLLSGEISHLRDGARAESLKARLVRKLKTHYSLSFHTYKKSASLAVATLRLPL
jgi:hypothetical protein